MPAYQRLAVVCSGYFQNYKNRGEAVEIFQAVYRRCVDNGIFLHGAGGVSDTGFDAG
jgi:hypothetical protein